MAVDVGGSGSAARPGGLPRPRTGDSYRKFSGVTILVRKDGRIVLPDGRVLPKGSRISQRNPNTPATINLPGSDDFLGFSNGVIVRNTPLPRTTNVSKREYEQEVYLDTSGRSKPGQGYGSRAPARPVGGRSGDDRRQVTQPVMPAAPRPAAPRPGVAPVRPVTPGGGRIPGAAAGGSDAVRQQQIALNAKGANLAVDGVYGPKTQAAAARYGGGTSPGAPPAAPRPGVAPSARPGIPGAALPAAPGGAVPAAKGVDAEVRRMFGDVAAFLSNPELGPILRKAAAEGWDQSRLFGALQQTRFWKTKGEDERKWTILNTLDNATARRQVEQQMQGINDATRQSGVALSGKQVHDLAVDALKFGWSAAEIRQKTFDLAGSIGKPGQGGGLDTAVTTQYGYLAAFLDDPEVGPLLERGAREGWPPARLEAELLKTNFWKTTSDAQRRFNAMQEQTPGQAQQMVSARTSELLTLSQSLGVQVDPKRLGKIAEDSLRFGWNDSQVRASVTAEFDYKGGEGGLAGQSSREIRQMASQYLVPISDQTLEQWTEQIVSGVSDMEQFNGYLVEQAKSLFPGMGAALDKGVTVAQYADPYKQIAARELEINPESIDLNDPRFRKMLDQVNGKGERVAMTLSESSEYLRKLPEWQQTRGANEKAAGLTESILRTFGATA